jgi:hypothetical protein
MRKTDNLFTQIKDFHLWTCQTKSGTHKHVFLIWKTRPTNLNTPDQGMTHPLPWTYKRMNTQCLGIVAHTDLLSEHRVSKTHWETFTWIFEGFGSVKQTFQNIKKVSWGSFLGSSLRLLKFPIVMKSNVLIGITAQRILWYSVCT